MAEKTDSQKPQEDYRSEQRKNLKDFFSAQAPRWDKRTRWNSYYKKKIAEFCSTLIPDEGRVLELGCGTGDLLARFKTSQCVGIDFSPEMISRAKEKYPDKEFLVDDAENIQTLKKFDVVVMTDLVDSLIDIWTAFREVRKVCEDHTRIVVTFHNHWWAPLVKLAEWLHIKNKQPIKNWVAPSDMKEILELNGFDIVRQGTRILIPIYIPIFSNLINKYFSALPILKHFCFARFLVARYQGNNLKQNDLSVSVMVPCLNEKGNIALLMERLPQMGSWMEIVFVDGGSTDGTIEVIEEEVKKATDKRRIVFLKQEGGKGKGVAVRQGFAAATADILMILDSDLSVAPEDLPKFYLAVSEDRGEMINGARLVYSMQTGAMRFFNVLGNHFFRMAFSWVLGQPIRDSLCGTKVMRRTDYARLAAARHYFGDFDPFGDFDLLFGAARLNLKIVNLPVRYDARIYGSTKIHRWSHGWLLLKMVWYSLWKLKFL